MNKVSLDPVHDVLVFNPEKDVYEVSDEKGRVNLSGLELLDSVFVQHQSYVYEIVLLDDLYKTGFVVYLTQKVVLIEEVVITASKSAETISELSNQVQIITDDEIRFRNPQTSADMLAQTGEVFVQKSQMGGGSPVLRGFEANKVLLVLDGVRMNNAIYRSGHLQNSITVDPSNLERAEVVFGPGAVIYGSDAIGGVMYFVTKQPAMATMKGKPNIKANVYGRFASVNMEKTGHASFNVGLKNWGSYTAFTYSDFDNMKMGAKRSHGFKGWGLSNYYVDRVNGQDVVVENEDPEKQVYSGYSQWNLLQKFRFKPLDHLDMTLAFHASSSSDIPRYEEMNDFEVDNDVVQDPKFAEWFYGPQKLYMASLAFAMEDRKAFDNGNIIAAYQWIEETRFKRKFGNDERTYNTEQVQVVSVNGDFSKKINETNTLRFGFEANYNRVQSLVRVHNIATDAAVNVPLPTRYPDGGSHTQAYAIYLMDKWKPSEKVIVQAGIRYNQFILMSSFKDTRFITVPESEFRLSKGALSGSVGVVYKPIEGLELKLSGSTGFRSPNVDDYGKIREKDGQVSLPNLELAPEYAYNVEAGLVKNFDNIARLSFTGFYTQLADAIVRSHARFNGSDSILYEGDSAYIVINENIQNARVYGFSVGFYTDIGRFISLTAHFNYTRGKEIPGKEPLAHIPPLFGTVSMLAKVKRFQTEIFVNFNGQKTRSSYSNYSEDRADEATVLGTPGWFTLNLRTTAQLHRMLTLQFAIENIFDQHYKPFSSGISAPGRNFVITLRGKF
ncbi:MAG: TonB-dependent receptor [Bacteroidetes bacterium]|nr:TonB-dependent receptor [Bacteroidota bacterium]